MKGSGQKNVTQTTINPAQQAQQPYLNFGWDQSKSLYQNNPQTYYPGQTLAGFRPPDPTWKGGYQDIYNAGQNIAGALPGYNANYNSLAQYAPQLAGYAQQAGANNNPALNSLMATAQGQGPGMTQLAASARGDYLNSNPHLTKAIEIAQAPTERAFRTSVMPSVEAALFNSGRYGSGAQAGLYDTSQQNLAKSLGDISSTMSSSDYGRERTLQDAAAGMYGQIGNQAGAAGGQLYNTGLNLGMSGLGAASDIQRQMAALFPQWAQAQMLPGKAGVQAGEGITNVDDMYRQFEQKQLEDQKARYYGNQKAPWDTLAQYMSSVGQPTQGSRSETTPYYSNPMASALSGISGLAGAGRNLGLFGGGAGAAGGIDAGLYNGLAASASPLFGGGGELGLASVVGGAPAAGAAGGGLGSILPAALAWIICTELKNQGKMPKRHWAAGLPVFAGYPERTKRGYYFWAIPTVKHLRRTPDSRFSRFIGAISCWRAENIAAKRGVRGARWRIRGALVTAIGYPLCATLGLIVSAQDWRQVYRAKEAE